ncbi:MAG: Fur family transcriptional regulator [Alphaproteobacteria bacterium]|nr:Fur family transcriptional regulator [Alphaproteobacteria bacterium]
MQNPAAFERGHDHQRCVRQALDAATLHCRREGVRLTPLRRKVLLAVWDSHIPLGAYQICDALAAHGDRVLPPTVYRALEFLERNGLVHRIPSANAFIGCNQPGAHHHGRYLICRDCGLVAELPAGDLVDTVRRDAGHFDFAVERVRLEALGRCPDCAAKRGKDR